MNKMRGKNAMNLAIKVMISEYSSRDEYITLIRKQID